MSLHMGEWGTWMEWTQCSHSCGPGERIRYRHCLPRDPLHIERAKKGTKTQINSNVEKETDGQTDSNREIEGKNAGEMEPMSDTVEKKIIGEVLKAVLTDSKAKNNLHEVSDKEPKKQRVKNINFSQARMVNEAKTQSKNDIKLPPMQSKLEQKIRHKRASGIEVHCVGNPMETEPCTNQPPCPRATVENAWSQWAEWGSCR